MAATKKTGRRASRTAYPRGAWARWCSCGRLSFLTLQRGNAVGDALRHRSTPRHLLKGGRRASRTAYPRASARCCSCGHLRGGSEHQFDDVFGRVAGFAGFLEFLQVVFP
ncbi:hypothetical protein DND58_02925 [Pseudomonas syringae pv. pisi]|nr:hypothetical protein DND62_05565 [Pseudomonas syringae pv. pisi]PYD32573.1 hypothetical protein DND67_13810 [Pseudomonas syringae pv. pisi]PYD33316.1 hypothetical protein DND58_02925 [Pseudomonas syringae pv. pisi]